MVEILKDIQQKYVPVDHQDDKVVLKQTAFAWDQLTAARAQKSQTVRVNSKSPTDAVRGLMPLAADWDAKVKFMEVWCFDTWMCIRKCVWLYSCHHGTKQYWKMSLLPSVLLWVCNTRRHIVSFPDPPPKRKGGSGEYSTISHYGLAVAMDSAKSQVFEVSCWASVNWKVC